MIPRVSHEYSARYDKRVVARRRDAQMEMPGTVVMILETH